MLNEMIFNFNEDRDTYVVSKPGYMVHTQALIQLANHIQYL